MAINYPTSLDALTNPVDGDKTDNPNHADQHANENDILEALEAKVGVDSSAVVTSLDYIVNNDLVKKIGDTMSGDLLIYDPVNDGNPQLRIGSDDANEGHIQAVFDSGAQTLDYLLISTDSAGEGDIVFSPASVFVGIGTSNTRFCCN